jgi:asparagine synthase (glutamine-hydrolysing)
VIRYIAFVWDAHYETLAGECIRRACAQNGQLKAVFEAPHLVVLASIGPSDPKPQLLSNDGVLLGSLFIKPAELESQYARAVLSRAEAQRIITTRGDALVEHYWGNYVAFMRGESDYYPFRAIRSPFARLPCLHSAVDGLRVYASDMQTLAGLRIRLHSISWHVLARTFMGPEPAGSCHLNEVRELAGGECEDASGSQCRRLRLWDPVRIASQPFHASAAIALRSTARACVQAWANEYPHVAVGLSGGLDSSVTLSCIGDSPNRPRITAITQFGEDTESDERTYARLVAHRAGCDLIEVPRTTDTDLRAGEYSAVFECSPGLHLPSVDRNEPEIAHRLGAGAIFRGHGGDELFCRNWPSLSATDFLYQQGFGAGVFDLLAHAAITEGITIWHVLARALWSKLRPARVSPSAMLARDLADGTLLDPDVLQALTSRNSLPPHEDALPPGRRWQVHLLNARRSLVGPFDLERDPDPICPLLSQPLVELCLRIPTWLQMTGHTDRALTRAAFARDLPPEVLNRTEKGAAEQMASTILFNNLPYLRERLLDGLVVRSGIIDRQRLEASLSAAPALDALMSPPIFELLGAENWARAWRDFNAAQNRTFSDNESEENSSRPNRLA